MRPSNAGASVGAAALLVGLTVILAFFLGTASFPHSVAAAPEAVVDGGGPNEEEASCPSREDSAAASSSSDADPRDGYVRVYDRVFSPRLLAALADLCLVHDLRYPDGTFYVRHRPTNALQRAIDAMLDAFGDESPYVEVWTRKRHLNMDAHCDLDESLMDDAGRLSSPDMGHVVYLAVDGAGDEAATNPMPITIFPDRRVGWNADGTHDDASPNDARNVEMVVVPAVPGRMVRFDGRAMHGVPRPADRYLISEKELYDVKEILADDDDEFFDEEEEEENMNHDEDEARVTEEGAHWYDWKSRGVRLHEEKDEERPLRFVLLFNTWSKTPPTKVGTDDSRGNMMKEKTDAMLRQKWEGELGPNLERLTQSIDHSKWEEVSIKPPPPEVESVSSAPSSNIKQKADDIPIRVKLMGPADRRVHAQLHASLYADLPTGEALAKAVREKLQPSRFLLRQKST